MNHPKPMFQLSGVHCKLGDLAKSSLEPMPLEHRIFVDCFKGGKHCRCLWDADARPQCSKLAV